MSKWQVLDLLGFEGPIVYARGALNLHEVKVPLREVSTILIGRKATWGYGLIAAAERFDIHILICDWRNIPIGIVEHTSSVSRVGARQRAQAAMHQRSKHAAWKAIIIAKIRGQAAVLYAQGHHRAGDRLHSIAKTTRTGDSTNTEALAARIYWKHFYPGFSRNQLDGSLPNAALNYGYTVLRGAVLMGICASGLLPGLGLHHGNESNPYPLADDLIEPFRPAIDYTVLKLLRSNSFAELDAPAKTMLANVLEARDGEGRALRHRVNELCSALGQYVENRGPLPTVTPWAPRPGDEANVADGDV